MVVYTFKICIFGKKILYYRSLLETISFNVKFYSVFEKGGGLLVSMVYCMECNQLVDEKLCTGIMKTGFYKINIPVANQCVHCKDRADQETIRSNKDETK